jgi:hypothetical protein
MSSPLESAFVALVAVAHRTDIAAAAKAAAGAGQHHGAHGCIALAGLDRIAPGVEHRWRERVETIRTVKADRRDAVDDLEDQLFAAHGRDSSCTISASTRDIPSPLR